ncbi:MAG: 30S ribosomal protein S8 [Proteobacteria bacterium]|nr:30S ribosomal protein S8 [Pseudomonadota bacterium]
MAMTDPIADMLTRIRNGQMVRKSSVRMPASKLKLSILEVLKEEGYIIGYKEVEGTKFPELEVELKYYAGKPVISEIERISKPGLRKYSAATDIPMVRNGLGVAILSTSRGVMTDAKARTMNVGGELICRVF